MKEFNLSEKIDYEISSITTEGEFGFIDERDAKEKIQNAQRRLKEFSNKLMEAIEQIFKEEFGEKLT